MVKHWPTIWGTWVRSLGLEDPLEKEMAAHSSTLAWKIPQMEESGRLQSMGSQRVGHDWATSLSLWDSSATNVTCLVMVTHVAKASFIFKVCFSLLLYFQVQWFLFLFSPLCYWAHPLIFLFWLLYLFVFIVFVCIYCIYLYLLYLFWLLYFPILEFSLGLSLHLLFLQ